MEVNGVYYKNRSTYERCLIKKYKSAKRNARLCMKHLANADVSERETLEPIAVTALEQFGKVFLEYRRYFRTAA